MEDKLFNECRKKAVNYGVSGINHLIPIALESCKKHPPEEKPMFSPDNNGLDVRSEIIEL